MIKRRNDIHLDGRLYHHIDKITVVVANILDNHVVHLHQPAIRLELFRLVFRNYQVARVRVRVHARLVGRIHNELDRFYRNVARQNGLFGGVIVNEPAIETHQEKARLVEAILLRKLLCARERTPGAEHQLVPASKHSLDSLHVYIENGLVVGQKRTVKVCKEQLHVCKYKN